VSIAESLDILYEDNHCLALNKPAGWPTTHFDGKDETVDRLAKTYLREKYKKPGNVFLGVVHRLDKPVSGVLLFARTSKAASRLSEQFREGSVEKTYWAVVEDRLATGGSKHSAVPWVTADSGSLEDWLKKDDPQSKVEVVPQETPGARFARLLFSVRGRHDGLTWLELRPHTGRKHQLRVQLASRGCPIYGDDKYGSDRPFGPSIALHARSLTFLHPTTKEPMRLKAEIPNIWRGRFAHLLAKANT
jgi:23S rRNA pseudouridine1911/1915/1917 synthase